MSEQDREVALITNLAFITRIAPLVKPNQKVSCMRNKKTDAFSVRLQNCRQITALREDRHLTRYAHLPHPAPPLILEMFFSWKTSSTLFLRDLFESNVNINVSASYLHPSLRQSQLLSPDPGSFSWPLTWRWICSMGMAVSAYSALVFLDIWSRIWSLFLRAWNISVGLIIVCFGNTISPKSHWTLTKCASKTRWP